MLAARSLLFYGPSRCHPHSHTSKDMQGKSYSSMPHMEAILRLFAMTAIASHWQRTMLGRASADDAYLSTAVS